jgi:hypothetical protein
LDKLNLNIRDDVEEIVMFYSSIKNARKQGEIDDKKETKYIRINDLDNEGKHSVTSIFKNILKLSGLEAQKIIEYSNAVSNKDEEKLLECISNMKEGLPGGRKCRFINELFRRPKIGIFLISAANKDRRSSKSPYDLLSLPSPKKRSSPISGASKTQSIDELIENESRGVSDDPQVCAVACQIAKVLSQAPDHEEEVVSEDYEFIPRYASDHEDDEEEDRGTSSGSEEASEEVVSEEEENNDAFDFRDLLDEISNISDENKIIRFKEFMKEKGYTQKEILNIIAPEAVDGRSSNITNNFNACHKATSLRYVSMDDRIFRIEEWLEENT